MIGVVIPAHNESAVLGRCLDALLDGFAPGQIDVVVVCNGCTDDTAGIAGSHAPLVRVVQTDVPSKSNALNLGDAASTGFPRLYVDADVVLSGDAVRKVAAVLESGPTLAAAPRLVVDTRGKSWAVRSYYAVWDRLPYARSGMIGSGVYALSEAGRARFGSFPKITADDAYVRLHFAPHERQTLESCTFTITPPSTLDGIVHIKTRSQFGNDELRRHFPQLSLNEGADHRPAMLKLAANPAWWPALGVYVYAKLAVRRRVRQRLARHEIEKWERDETSRQLPGQPASR